MEENQKKNWRDTRFNSSETQSEIESIISGKRRTALQALAAGYKRFSYISLCSILLCAPLMQPHIMPYAPMKWPIVILFVVYMLVASMMDNWLYKGISAIDIAEMPVAEVARLAAFYRKRHIQFIFVLIPFALAFLCGMCWYSVWSGFLSSLAGIAVGATVGLFIGLRELRKFMADYRDITRE